MQFHVVQAIPSRDCLPKPEQLAWNLAAVAADDSAPIGAAVTDAVIARLIDNIGSALTMLDHPVVANARSQAVAHIAALHPRAHGARIIGLPATKRYGVEWAAYVNATAISASEHRDTFSPAAGDAIPAVLAVAQQCGCSGADLLRGIVAAVEIHVALANAIDVDAHGIDPVLHLAAAAAAGIGACLALDVETIHQSIQQALHTTTMTHLARGSDAGSWTAGHAGKLAIEAVDRCMRGEMTAGPIYEGEDGLLVRLLGGAQASYRVALPAIGEERRAILSANRERRAAVDHCDGFRMLAAGIVSEQEQQCFLQTVQRLPQLAAGELGELNVVADLIALTHTEPDGRGIF